MNDTNKVVLQYAKSVDKLQILNENLTNHLKKCANELEIEINSRYGFPDVHPSQKRKYDNDMKTVIDARWCINQSEKENGVPGYDD